MQAFIQNRHEFILRMIHDLRTPLNSLRGLIYMAKEDRAENPLKRLDMMEASVDYLLEIIDGSLEFNQISEGSFFLKQREFSMKNLTDSVKSIILPLALEKKQIFEVMVSGKISENMIGDPLRIGQILINLLSNSIKFTACGGSISLKISQTGQIVSKDLIEFQVTDSGIGMSKQFMAKMFHPFEQEKTGTDSARGSGLGLCIAKNLIELMEGKIDVSSKPGAGSVFKVTLPLFKSDNSPADYCKEDRDNYDFSKRRIIVAEDDQDSLDILRELLEKTGLIVDKAKNGLEAVKLFKASPKGHYDAVLIDMIMPVMGGLEAAKKIRDSDHPDSDKIIIISTTGNEYKNTEHESSVIDAGIYKPINYQKLYLLLDKMLPKNNV